MNTIENMAKSDNYDVVVLGAGYGGLMAALRLRRGTRRLRVALVNMRDEFIERVRLQESVVAKMPARIPPLPKFLPRTNIAFIRGEVISLDPDARRIRISDAGAQREIGFKQAIYALGSRVDVEAMPGAAAHAYRLDMGRGHALQRHCARDSA
jgi:NADH:ubiquinone reductase (H+-translocating)